MTTAITQSDRDSLWKQAQQLSNSELLPKRWRGKPYDVMMMMCQARELGMEPIAACRLTYVVHGEPSLKSEAVIGLVNHYAGMASEIMFEERGELMTDKYEVRAYAKSPKTGERLDGIWVGMRMVIEEGWGKSQKTGDPYNPKYRTPFRAQMLRYKAAAFWARLYAPQVMMGMYTVQEIEDMPQEPREVRAEPSTLTRLEAAMKEAEPEAEEVELKNPEPEDEDVAIMRGDYDGTHMFARDGEEG
jgi:hypothetical protein